MRAITHSRDPSTTRKRFTWLHRCHSGTPGTFREVNEQTPWKLWGLSLWYLNDRKHQRGADKVYRASTFISYLENVFFFWILLLDFFFSSEGGFTRWSTNRIEQFWASEMERHVQCSHEEYVCPITEIFNLNLVFPWNLRVLTDFWNWE